MIEQDYIDESELTGDDMFKFYSNYYQDEVVLAVKLDRNRPHNQIRCYIYNIGDIAFRTDYIAKLWAYPEGKNLIDQIEPFARHNFVIHLFEG
jgi:hypothetical protein